MRKLCNSIQCFAMYGLLLDLAPKKALIVLYKEPTTHSPAHLIDMRPLHPTTEPLCISLHTTLHDLLNNQKITLQEIKKICVSQGPGSFLGIRVGITVAQTLSLAKKIPIQEFPSPALYLPELQEDRDFLFLSHFNATHWLLTTGNTKTYTIKRVQKIKKTENLVERYPHQLLLSQEEIEGVQQTLNINLNLATTWKKNTPSTTHINIYYPEELQNIPNFL